MLCCKGTIRLSVSRADLSCCSLRHMAEQSVENFQPNRMRDLCVLRGNPVERECLCLHVTKTTYKRQTVTTQKPPGFYIHFGINRAHPSIGEASVRESTGGYGHLHRRAVLRDTARTKVGAGRSFMPAIFTNERTELLLQPMLAFQNPS